MQKEIITVKVNDGAILRGPSWKRIVRAMRDKSFDDLSYDDLHGYMNLVARRVMAIYGADIDCSSFYKFTKTLQEAGLISIRREEVK